MKCSARDSHYGLFGVPAEEELSSTRNREMIRNPVRAEIQRRGGYDPGPNELKMETLERLGGPVYHVIFLKSVSLHSAAEVKFASVLVEPSCIDTSSTHVGGRDDIRL